MTPRAESPPPPPPPNLNLLPDACLMLIGSMCEEVRFRAPSVQGERPPQPHTRQHTAMRHDASIVLGHRSHPLRNTCRRFRRLFPRNELIVEEMPIGMCSVS